MVTVALIINFRNSLSLSLFLITVYIVKLLTFTAIKKSIFS